VSSATPNSTQHPAALRVRRLRLFAQHEPIVVMRTDCHVCRSEGLSARARVLLIAGDREVHATLFQVEGDGVVAPGEAALSEEITDCP